MVVVPTVPVTAGRLRGVATFDRTLQTYSARFELFPDAFHGAAYPPAQRYYGTRTAEFLTTGALAGHLAALGLQPCPASVRLLDKLEAAIGASIGRAEVIGLTGPRRRYLLLVTPGRLVVEVNARMLHRDHRHHWGDDSPATVDTARRIAEHTLGRRSTEEIESFALALTHEVLAGAGHRFSLDAAGLVGWFSADGPVSTSLGDAELDQVARVIGLGGPARHPGPGS
ncbi:MAG: hypothetical protein ACK5PP_14830 [Acidimicrobiales bacterium]